MTVRAALVLAFLLGLFDQVSSAPAVIYCPPIPGAGARPQPTHLNRSRAFSDSLARTTGSFSRAPDASPLGIGQAGTESWDPVHFPGRQAPSLIVDALRGRLLLYGGLDGRGVFTGEVWSRPLSGPGVWTRLETVGSQPVPRMDHIAVYDPVRDRMIVYGGFSTDNLAASAVWALNLSGTPIWSELVPAGTGPGYRVGAYGAYDPMGDRVIVFGGHPVDSAPSQTDLWALELAPAPTWVRLSPAGAPPGPREDGIMFYDPVRQRMVLFGGCPGAYGIGAVNDVWALSLGGTSAWNQLQTSGDAIPGLHSFASAYDSVHDRLLVFSGRDSNFQDAPRPETWALQFTDPPVWSQIVPPLPDPNPREFARAVYDVARDRLLMYGGPIDDMWALSAPPTPAWSELESPSSSGPFAGYLASAAYDTASRRTLICGGESMYEIQLNFNYWDHGDVTGLNLASETRWDAVARDSTPLQRHGHSAIIDPIAERMIVFGGAPEFGSVVDPVVWQLPLAGNQPWSQLSAGGESPVARQLHSAVHDFRRHRMIVYGGLSPSGAREDVWSLSLDPPETWTRLLPAGKWPQARWGHTAAYDPIGDRMIVFGGDVGSGVTDETWQLSLSGPTEWSPLPMAQHPPARCMAAMVYDPLRQRLVLFGGQGPGHVPLADTWILSLADSSGWQPASVTGSSPSPRWGPAMAFDRAANHVVLFGGAVNPCGDGLGDTWILSSTVPVTTGPGLTSLQSHPWHVRLSWQTPLAARSAASVERHTMGTDWTVIASVLPDAAGRVTFEDTSAEPGARIAYRLYWTAGGTNYSTPEAWVDVPQLRFALAGATPNPAQLGLQVAFSLPDAAPARFQLVDVSGRLILDREVGSMGPGDHVLDLTQEALAAGIYLVRLERAGETLTSKACVLR